MLVEKERKVEVEVEQLPSSSLSVPSNDLFLFLLDKFDIKLPRTWYSGVDSAL